MRSFFAAYRERIPHGPADKARVLEIGSQSYLGQLSYRTLLDDGRYDYTGLDLSAGPNVDIVPKAPFVWNEFADASFEVCISGQTFEHNPFFWVTMSEMARVLAPGGYLCLVAPGSGPVHRYPTDCWRFYPDSWSALCALVGLELVETFWEPDSLAPHIDGGEWRDTMLIARKPKAEDGRFAGARERREQLVEPFRAGFGDFEAVSWRAGPASEDYMSRVERKPPISLTGKIRRRIARRIFPWTELRLFEPGQTG
jgi:SAM-dependent methyltransferase